MTPDSAPIESSGTARIKTVLGGRFLLEENEGSLMGQPTSGIRLWGFDNASGRYEATWVYTGSTGMMTLRGKGANDGKIVKWEAVFTDERGIDQTFDAITRQIDQDRFAVELIARTPDGTPGPSFETVYTRGK